MAKENEPKATGKAVVLVACNDRTDADLIAKMLRGEFDGVQLSVDPATAARDFDQHQPDVLILAFNGLETAERYYLGLYRQSQTIHHKPHRTLILCNKDDVRRVYELCRKDYFDDYMLFWPLTHDTPRLYMAVHQALKDLGAVHDDALKRQLAAQARRIAELETMLVQSLATGDDQVRQADHRIREAGVEIDAALDRFSHRLMDGQLAHAVEVRDAEQLRGEIGRLGHEEIQKQLTDVAKSIGPMRDWVAQFRQDVTPYLEAAHAMKAAAAQVRPMVLVVEDEAFQRKLIGHMLGDDQYELVYAETATAALGTMRKKRPDLVLMDFELPDVDGIAVTRQIREMPHMAHVPIVMLTGHGKRELVVKSMQAGATDFAVKPVNAETLRAKVERHLGKG